MDKTNIVEIYAAIDPNALQLLTPISDDTAYQEALEAACAMMQRMGEDQYHPLRPVFDILAERIEQYESKICDLSEPLAQDCLAYLMEKHSISHIALAEASSVEVSDITDVLAGKRLISLELAEKLAQYFEVEVTVFS